jgi:hypothetical protein
MEHRYRGSKYLGNEDHVLEIECDGNTKWTGTIKSPSPGDGSVQPHAAWIHSRVISHMRRALTIPQGHHVVLFVCIPFEAPQHGSYYVSNLRTLRINTSHTPYPTFEHFVSNLLKLLRRLPGLITQVSIHYITLSILDC